MPISKPYVYDATSRVLYIDLVFWEGLSANDKIKIVELSEGNFPDTIGEHDESFALVIRGDATNEKHRKHLRLLSRTSIEFVSFYCITIGIKLTIEEQLFFNRIL